MKQQSFDGLDTKDLQDLHRAAGRLVIRAMNYADDDETARIAVLMRDKAAIALNKRKVSA